MMKECVILDGKVINVGQWDYQYENIDGEQVAKNPIPQGATTEQRDMEYDENRGWYEVGTAETPSIEERLKSAEDTITMLLGL